MASSLNRATIIGNLGKDPEVRYMSDGTAVANVTVATTETWKDKNGQKQEKTEWHRVTFYRKLAEIVGEYLKKGSTVYVEGRLETREWEDKQGVKRYTTEIIANELKMFGGGSGKPQGKEAPGTSQSKALASNEGNFGDMDDDIPF